MSRSDFCFLLTLLLSEQPPPPRMNEKLLTERRMKIILQETGQSIHSKDAVRMENILKMKYSEK